jgi:hypothetical protein
VLTRKKWNAAAVAKLQECFLNSSVAAALKQPVKVKFFATTGEIRSDRPQRSSPSSPHGRRDRAEILKLHGMA